MNPHIARGNKAIGDSDLTTASEEFLRALDDPDPLIQRIARNRLYDIHGEAVYGSTHSYKGLYHRPSCAAKNVIWRNHIVWFRDWRDAETKGFGPCQQCRPVRPLKNLQSAT